jgi:hypothetical protein
MSPGRVKQKNVKLVFVASPQICRSTWTHYADSEPTSLLFLLNDAFLAEKQQIPILHSFVQSQCELLPSLGARRLSFVYFSQMK